MDEMNRDEVIEQLEEQAVSEDLDVVDLPANPELEGGFDLKSAGIGIVATVLIGAGCYYGPKAVKKVKSFFNRKKKKDDDIPSEEELEDAEDAEYQDVDDPDEEPEEKK